MAVANILKSSLGPVGLDKVGDWRARAVQSRVRAIGCHLR